MSDKEKAKAILDALITKAQGSSTMIDSASSVFYDQESLTSELLVTAVAKTYRSLARRIITSPQIDNVIKNSLVDFDLIGFPLKYQIFESIDSVSVEVHELDASIRVIITLVLASSKVRVYTTDVPLLPIDNGTEVLPPPKPPIAE